MAQTVSLWWSERSGDHFFVPTLADFRKNYAPRKRGEANAPRKWSPLRSDHHKLTVYATKTPLT